VRGEGGVLKNNRGERFAFNYVPEMYRGEFAETEQEADRWVAGIVSGRPSDARRPPELLTRDVIARAIRREVNEGRGGPHGGVFLDVASRRTPEEIIKKLPGMYHQFKELADVDITRDPMEVGPTCHYMMGGVRVDSESQESTVPGLFAAGEVAGGMHGSNRLGGNSLSDLLVFGKRAGEFAALHAKQRAAMPAINPDDVERAAREALTPFDAPTGENAYTIHGDLQTIMQRRVGIVRSEEDLKIALEELARLHARAARVKATGNIQYNPGWHLALDLKNMIDISEAVTRAALTRTESRGAHTREDYPDSDKEWGRKNVIIGKEGDALRVSEAPLPAPPAELSEILKVAE
jgi:succinate dehydrogenase / fumarate reductase flavoprotein subunit